MNEEVIIPIVAILMPLALVPTIILMKQAGKRREWEHQERMRAMDLGLAPAGPSGGTFWPSMATIAIGAGVPIASLLFALLAQMTGRGGDEVWGCSAGVGVTAVLCGAVLGFRLIGSGRRASGPAPSVFDHHAKPSQFDPDAYDTVGRRG